MILPPQGVELPSRSESNYEEVKDQLVDFCKKIAGSRQITALCIVGDCTVGYTEANEVMETLIVIRDFQPRLTTRIKPLGDKNIIILCVDKWIFERDVDKAFLGEAIVERIIFPYIPLVNKDYLYLHEVRLKKRLILELLENLVWDFPELSYSFRIKPEYFMYETMMSRARLFPPMVYSVSNFLKEDLRNRNVDITMHGYNEALRELEEENTIVFLNGYVKISKEFMDKVLTKRIRFVNLFKTAQKALFASFLGVFSKTVSFLSQNRERTIEFLRLDAENSEFLHQLEDPQKYLYIPTAHGLVSLSNKMNIEGFARKVLSRGKRAEIDIEKIGGALNDVYLVKASTNKEKEKIVVKRFKDWSSFKWFPLNLWTLGTKTFAVLGRSRLEKECAINQLLHSNGFGVPKILHVSHAERLVFKEYIEGEKLSKIIRDTLRSEDDDCLEAISKVGKIFAKVHALDIALGDTKPENIMIRQETAEVYLLDLEQASRKGDKVWDIAEFLYYSGHYCSPISSTNAARIMAINFLKGYLEVGGKKKVVKKAGSAKYTKVFSVFTSPHVLFTISSICQKMGKE